MFKFSWLSAIHFIFFTRVQQISRTFQDQQSFSSTFLSWKVPQQKSRTFQVFQDPYKSCNYLSGMILLIYWQVKLFCDRSHHQNLSLISVVKHGYVLYLLRQRIYNSRYYVKKDKRVAGKEQVQADKEDHDRIYKTNRGWTLEKERKPCSKRDDGSDLQTAKKPNNQNRGSKSN